ncbi:MAG TPA: enoyl-CoA hydratase-related protein [Solirubrobacteraceae bacterium]|jgi:2-(1,2-epoxy-1,2-dihydrophenyl)acetyl-CoA isomerase|nr:enoyl-CoA hydratase-related protein [Solirubrobacteraceae bacterium]
MSLAPETVVLNIAGGVARITLNRPEALNAWTRELGHELRSALEHSAQSPEVRAIVLTGAGRAFSSGADLRGGFELTPEGKPDVLTPLRETYNPVILRVRTIPKPVIAAVNGPAAGIGCSLALAADLVLAAESSYFLLAFANIGLGLDGGASIFLPARVGHARAFELAYLGERLPADRALEWGLINRVVPDAAVEAEVGALARRLAAGPPGSYATIKASINDELYPRLERQLDDEAVRQQERAGSADFMEGVLAFMEKRPAAFTGD